MIRHDEFKIVPSSRFAGMIRSAVSTVPNLIRTPLDDPLDVERWLWLYRVHPDVTDTAWTSMEQRVAAARRLLFTRWLVDRKRCSDD